MGHARAALRPLRGGRFDVCGAAASANKVDRVYARSLGNETEPLLLTRNNSGKKRRVHAAARHTMGWHVCVVGVCCVFLLRESRFN